MANEIKTAIEQNATGPKRASGDSGSVEQHSLPDQIAAETRPRRLGVAAPGSPVVAPAMPTGRQAGGVVASSVCSASAGAAGSLAASSAASSWVAARLAACPRPCQGVSLV